MGDPRRLVLIIAMLLMALVGCGGGEATGGSETASDEERLYPWLKGPTREFLVPEGGDNAVQMFGREATEAEREQASKVIHAWMRARAAKDWENDCMYMSRAYRKALVVDAFGVTDGKVKNCPDALAYFGPSASGDYKNTLSGPIDSLRVETGQAFAQYHGNDGKRDWVVPMDKEDGEWKVATAAPINRLR